MAINSENGDELSNEVVLQRLLALLTPEQLGLFASHCEVVAQHGYGQATITWRDGKPDLIYHQASDKA